MRRPDIGDIVQILRAPDTIAAGFADRTGTCHGFTTPSVTGVDVIGPGERDEALYVTLDDGTAAWFDASLVTFLDVDAGQTAVIGSQRFVRLPSGEWVKEPE